MDVHSSSHSHTRIKHIQTRWPAWLALVITGLLYEALPKYLYVGPHGLMLVLVVLLIIPMIVVYQREDSHIYHILSVAVNILITSYLIASVSRIVIAILEGNIQAVHLLSSAITLWVTNVFVFALWYWNLDAGGPTQRELSDKIKHSAFLFPQLQILISEDPAHLISSIKRWKPQFIDYLFLAFNTSTAFSPTDTPVLSRWAKLMSMIQAIVSLTIVVMLAARAINLLTPGM